MTRREMKLVLMTNGMRKLSAEEKKIARPKTRLAGNREDK